MRPVDFFVCGVQKAGTTTLHSALARHPAIFLPEHKELHWFDRETIDWTRPDLSELHASVANAGPHQIIGDITPIYLYWPDAMARIAAYNGAAKMIVVLRDPVDRAYSHWVMESARGRESLPFAEAIRTGRARVATSPDSVRGAHRTFSYVERGFYGAQIQTALREFDASKLHIIDFETLTARPAEACGALCSFLGIPTRSDLFETLPHCRRSGDKAGLDPADRAHLRNLFRPDLERLLATPIEGAPEVASNILRRWETGTADR